MPAPSAHPPLHELLDGWFRAALDGLDPGRATRDALAAGPPPGRAPAILAIGKAATGMARGALAWLDDHGLSPVGGLVVTATDEPSPHPALRLLCADHPVPGERSRDAAAALAATIAALPVDTPVEVLLSGGTSSLIAAPVGGVPEGDLQDAFECLHAIGLPIHAMNALRRRLTRWSGGRLATALAPRPVRAWVISDVVDNDLAVIGSGPLVAEQLDPSVIGILLREHDLAGALPPSVIAALATPPAPPSGPVPHTLVADRHAAARAAALAIRADGGEASIASLPLSGDAGEEAVAVVRHCWRRSRQHAFLEMARSGIIAYPTPPRLVVRIWTGETTVRLPEPHGEGGRAQQFALAAAGELHRIARTLEGGTPMLTLLAAGTDGRDGPTDAAGAIVDGDTWARMLAAGVDPAGALARADAHPALDRVGALLRTGPTGTNVADLVMVAGWE